MLDVRRLTEERLNYGHAALLAYNSTIMVVISIVKPMCEYDASSIELNLPAPSENTTLLRGAVVY